VIDIVQTHAATTTYVVIFLANGVQQTVTWASGADLAAADAAAVAAWEANEFIADLTFSPAGTGVITGMPGVEIAIISATDDTAATISVTLDTQADALPTFALVRDDGAPILDALPQTVPVGPLIGSAVPCADASGSNWYAVEAPAASLAGTDVYVETDDSGDDLGRLYDTASATRTPWPAAKWVAIDASDPTIAYIAL
jgi:hypothetical protein